MRRDFTALVVICAAGWLLGWRDVYHVFSGLVVLGMGYFNRR